MITWIFWELSLASKENPLVCPFAVSREFTTEVQMESLESRSDDELNNDVNSLYVEGIDKNRTYYKCTICGRILSRKQRLKIHLSSIHGKEGYHIRKFKRYLDNPSVPVPKSTKFDREQAFSNTFHGERSHLDSSICRRRSSVVNRVKCVSNICTRPRRDYVRLQRRFGILAHKWMHTVGSLPKLRKWC